MIWLFSIIYAIRYIFDLLGYAIERISKKISNKQKNNIPATYTRRTGYGICEKCGKECYLHRLDDKRYCAKCYSILKTEKDLGVKIDSDYWEKQNEHIKRT